MFPSRSKMHPSFTSHLRSTGAYRFSRDPPTKLPNYSLCSDDLTKPPTIRGRPGVFIARLRLTADVARWSWFSLFSSSHLWRYWFRSTNGWMKLNIHSRRIKPGRYGSLAVKGVISRVISRA